jgi:hypothetical protein
MNKVFVRSIEARADYDLAMAAASGGDAGRTRILGLFHSAMWKEFYYRSTGVQQYSVATRGLVDVALENIFPPDFVVQKKAEL